VDGGYAEYVCANENFTFALPDSYDDASAAPLLCAGLIGYRSLKMTTDADRIGIYGFGAAAHIITQVAKAQGREIYAFVRSGDEEASQLATKCGAVWAGDSVGPAPVELDAAIIFAPVGALVPLALQAVRRGGTVVCGGIHMSDIPAFPYELLWGERVVRSVANLRRSDAQEFLEIAAKSPIHTETTSFPLVEANVALDRLRSGQLHGAAVLVP
jgi:alcohol dehydrogenase, propanol-preferring